MHEQLGQGKLGRGGGTDQGSAFTWSVSSLRSIEMPSAMPSFKPE